METFVVRVWVATPDGPAGAGGGALRGVVEHVRSGSSVAFRDALELVERLREMAPDSQGRKGDP